MGRGGSVRLIINEDPQPSSVGEAPTQTDQSPGSSESQVIDILKGENAGTLTAPTTPPSRKVGSAVRRKSIGYADLTVTPTKTPHGRHLGDITARDEENRTVGKNAASTMGTLQGGQPIPVIDLTEIGEDGDNKNRTEIPKVLITPSKPAPVNLSGEILSLARELRKHVIKIPNLKPLFCDWAQGRSPWYERLRQEIANETQSLVPWDYRRQAVEDADPALMASFFWPNAPYPELKVLAHLIIWQGLWDDIIENYNQRDPQRGNQLRRETKLFLNKCLDVGHWVGLKEEAEREPLFVMFHTIADAAWARYDYDQRRRLRDCLFRYVDSTEIERNMMALGKVPGFATYWKLRASVGGVGPLIGMTEFAARCRLPPEVFKSAEWQTMCNSLNIIVCLTNDLFSLKKEFAEGYIYTALPVEFCARADDDMDLAVSSVVYKIKRATCVFDQAHSTLGARYHSGPNYNSSPEDVAARRAVASAGMVLKTIATGNLDWSIMTKRYGMLPYRKQDGSFEFTLE